MVFSSVPLYLDPPNWQQHTSHQQLQGGNNNTGNNHHDNQHLIQPQQIPQPQMGMGGGGPGAQQIRPNSMSERARLAKIPPPEAPLKCPRCDSTNTKFCYFNNYSLTQPRHFCKTCRRYWTRGGALRNVPVGGGCRRNKRSSSKSSSGGGGGSSSKSSISSLGGERHSMDHLINSTGGINISSTLSGLPSGAGGIGVGGGGGGMSFMASLQNIAQLGGMANMGLAAFGGSLHSSSNPLQGLSGLTGGGSGTGVGGDHHQLDYSQLNHPHQQVQFPNFLGGFEMPSSANGGGGGGGGLYSSSFQNDSQEVGGDDQEQVNDMSKSSTSMMSQFAPVKREDRQEGINLAKQLMGISSSSSDNATSNNANTNNNNNNNNNHFWGGSMTNAAAATSMWTDLSGLNSSSTSHLL